jgi:hypothetical protein
MDLGRRLQNRVHDERDTLTFLPRSRWCHQHAPGRGGCQDARVVAVHDDNVSLRGHLASACLGLSRQVWMGVLPLMPIRIVGF